MVTIRRQAITLLEMIIVIALLSLAAGIAAIGVQRAITEQKFRTEVSLIGEELRLAQDLMLILGTDAHVHFEADDKNDGIKYYLELETALPTNIQREILRKKKPLKLVKGVFLRDELLNEIKENHIDIKFLSNGSVMSKGILRLASTDSENPPEGTLQNFICLAGYPRPISISDSKEEAERLCVEINKDLDERIAQDTFSKVPDKLKQKKENEEKETESKPKETEKDKKTEQSSEKNSPPSEAAV